MKNQNPFLTLFIFLILFTPLCHGQSQREVKVMSYNVLLGLRQDSLLIRQCADRLRRENIDIAAFQELNGFKEASFLSFAAGYGHPYAVLLKEKDFPVGITSRYPITDVVRVVDGMHHGYMYAKTMNYHVFTLHLSPHSFQKREEEIGRVLAHAARLPQNEPILILGDFNSVSRYDSRVYDTEERLKKALMMENRYDYVANLKNGRIDYRVTDAVAEAGFLDTYTLKNEGFAVTFPTKSFEKKDTYYGGPCRIDFIWVNEALATRCLRSQVMTNEDTDQISDHYPITATFKF